MATPMNAQEAIAAAINLKPMVIIAAENFSYLIFLPSSNFSYDGFGRDLNRFIFIDHLLWNSPSKLISYS